MTSMQSQNERIRHAIGSQPVFFEDPVHDVLVGMIVALVGEVSVLRDRIDAHERLAEESNVFSKGTVDSYVPNDSIREERHELRTGMLSRVFAIIKDRLDPDQMSKETVNYNEVLSDLLKNI